MTLGRQLWRHPTGGKHEGRRIPEIPARRGRQFADRFRDGQAGTEGARYPRRREGDLRQPRRLQGAQARRAAGRRNKNPRLRCGRRRRCGRARCHPVQAGRRGVLRRLDPAPGHQFGISPGGRAHRRPKAEEPVVRAGRRAAPHLDHRLGIAVRPPRRRARQEPRSAHAADHRRRRRRRLDPDPAGAAADRADRRRHRDAAGVAEMVPRPRRPCGDRPRQADEGADRGAETAAGRRWSPASPSPTSTTRRSPTSWRRRASSA